MKGEKIPREVLNMKVKGKCLRETKIKMGKSGSERCHTERGRTGEEIEEEEELWEDGGSTRGFVVRQST
jgi:hypothetical protein